MTARQRSALVAATWLIGLGTVFLLREANGWSWSQAWPLFVILVGIGALVSRLAWPRHRAGSGIGRLWSFTWPVAWIAAGIALLLATTETIPLGAAELVDAYWPWVAIGLGVWFLVGAVMPIGEPLETLAIDVAGRPEARLDVKFGAGELHVGRAAPGHLVDGTYRGGVAWREASPGRFVLEQDVEHGLPWLDHDAVWSTGLTEAIPLDLRFDTGACRADIDLGELRVRTLDLHTGASQTRVRLPRAAGLTRVRAEAGAAELVLEVPDGVAAHVRGGVAIGSLVVDETRFPKRLDGAWASPDDPGATNRVEIEIAGGLGSVRVIGPTPAALAA